jgi:hypothetical protein
MPAIVIAFVVLAWTGALFAQTEAPLPVKKVVLYKNGVGYFEHRGRTAAEGTVSIELPSHQLNDVLKSLTVIDVERGSQVAGVSYTTLAPLERRLGEIPLDLGTAEGLVDFLNQVKGARVQIQAAGGAVSGKLLGAEVRRRRVGSDQTVETTEALVFTAEGQVRALEVGSAAAVRLLDRELSSQVSRYLDLMRSSHERDVRRLDIRTIGGGSRALQVSYTSEAPIWKTTYRLVLDEGAKPLLQGWAIVDNVSAMSWEDVELALVAGAPVSFVQNLSQPIYAHRPEVPLPEGVQVSPQTHGAALDLAGGPSRIAGTVLDSTGEPLPGATLEAVDREGNLVRQATSDSRGRFEISMPSGVYSVSASLTGFRTHQYADVGVQAGRTRQLDFRLEVASVAETVTVAAEPPALAPQEGRARAEPKSMAPRVGGGIAGGIVGGLPAAPPLAQALRESEVATAEAGALGDQFEYRLKHPVTIGRNQSALLPIVQTELAGEKVSIYNEQSGDPRPRLAVWLTNQTALTLDAGSFTVIDGNAFAGEGLTDTIRPSEKRLLSYGLDLYLDVAVEREGAPETVTRVAIGRGILRRQVKLARKTTYVTRNQDDAPRILMVEHPVEGNWKLVDTPPPVESTASHHRFRVEAAPGATTEFAIREESPQETTYALSNVSAAQITLWLNERAIDPEVERTLREVVAKREAIESLGRQIETLDREHDQIFRDQERLRENLGKLGGSGEEKGLRRRYVAELEKQENRLAAIRSEREKLESDRLALQHELDALVRGIAFEKSL